MVGYTTMSTPQIPNIVYSPVTPLSYISGATHNTTTKCYIQFSYGVLVRKRSTYVYVWTYFSIYPVSFRWSDIEACGRLACRTRKSHVGILLRNKCENILILLFLFRMGKRWYFSQTDYLNPTQVKYFDIIGNFPEKRAPYLQFLQMISVLNQISHQWNSKQQYVVYWVRCPSRRS